MRRSREKRLDGSARFVLSRRLTVQVRSEINGYRLMAGMPPLKWLGETGFGYEGRKHMSDLCEPCKSLGYTVIAHYQGKPAGASNSGQRVPPKCYYHHFDMPLPKSVTGQSASSPLENEDEERDDEAQPLKQEVPAVKIKGIELTKQCRCSPECPVRLRADSMHNYAKGHKRAAAVAAPVATPKITVPVLQAIPEVVEGATQNISVPLDVAIYEAKEEKTIAVNVSERFLDHTWGHLSLEQKAELLFGKNCAL